MMNVTSSPSCSCAVPIHRCGEPCKLFGRSGCLEYCTKVSGDSSFLILAGRTLRSHRTGGMLKRITCAPRQFICVARYGPLFNSQTFSQHVNVLALRPPRNDAAGWEDPFLSGTL
jgi:hypothetical protein